MRRKIRPQKQKAKKVPGKRGRPPKNPQPQGVESNIKRVKREPFKRISVREEDTEDNEVDEVDPLTQGNEAKVGTSEELSRLEDTISGGLHMTTAQVDALSSLVACRECGEGVILGIRPTTKGMISEFTVSCTVCEDRKSTNTPNLIRERKRKKEKKGAVLQKTENINYAHVAAFLDNGLGYSGLRHYCKYFNARCLNEATFIVYARQVIQDVVLDTEENLQLTARIVRKAFESQLENDNIIDLTVSFTTTYHQWGSDFCLVAGAVIELQTGLVLDYDVANMYCHVCKINAKKIVTMTPAEMTDWFNRHQDTCEIREWCDELDHDAEEGVKEIEPKYLECFVAKKIWARSVEKFGFRYTTLIHESDERIHSELLKAAPYGDIPVLIDTLTNCFSRRKSEHARTAFQNKLKSKCPRERVQTKDRIMYVYAMSIPEYNRFAVGSNIKLRELVRRMEEEDEAANEITLQVAEILPDIEAREALEEMVSSSLKNEDQQNNGVVDEDMDEEYEDEGIIELGDDMVENNGEVDEIPDGVDERQLHSNSNNNSSTIGESEVHLTKVQNTKATEVTSHENVNTGFNNEGKSINVKYEEATTNKKEQGIENTIGNLSDSIELKGN